MAKLTEKQQTFADEYLQTLNAADAYRKAGYAAKTNATQRAAASRLLTNVNVSEYLSTRLNELKLNEKMSQEEVIERLTNIARGTPTTTAFKRIDKTKRDDEGNPVVEYDTETTVAPDTGSQLQALEDLGKYYKLFTERQEINARVGPVTITDDIPDKGDDEDG